MRGFLGSLLLIAVVFPGQAFAFECGDLDASGTIGATDALRVLRRAVGPPATLQCPGDGCGTTSTIPTPPTTIFRDECVIDDDCEGIDPQKLYCCNYKCAECNLVAGCGVGQVCASGCKCIDAQ